MSDGSARLLLLNIEASRRRRGSTYLAVLGASLIVAAIGCGALVAARLKGRQVDWSNDGLTARQALDSALDIARSLIRQDANWRSNRPHGVWCIDEPLAGALYSIEVRDSVDGDLANRPHDAVTVTVTATVGAARQRAQIDLQAEPVPLDALRCALHSCGEIEVNGVVNCLGGIISTNSTFDNSNTVTGNIEAVSVENPGIVIGGISIVGPKPSPTADIVAKYAALGTEIAVSGDMNKIVLAPGRNPWGSVNSDGVYVWRPTGNVKIQNSRIHGTLVIFCPSNKTVQITNSVLIHPYRADYPSLVIQGDVDLHCANLGLVELTNLTNYNPPGAPYNGVTNSTTLDTFPSEIQGLVYITGEVKLKGTTTIRGMLFASNTGSKAVKIQDLPQLIYMPELYQSPPQWFTSEVKMPLTRGSYQQLVD